MKEWLVRMNKKKEPYVSDFCKWSRSVIVSSVLLLFGCEWLDQQLTVQDLYNPDDYEIELYMIKFCKFSCYFHKLIVIKKF